MWKDSPLRPKEWNWQWHVFVCVCQIFSGIYRKLQTTPEMIDYLQTKSSHAQFNRMAFVGSEILTISIHFSIVKKFLKMVEISTKKLTNFNVIAVIPHYKKLQQRVLYNDYICGIVSCHHSRSLCILHWHCVDRATAVQRQKAFSFYFKFRFIFAPRMNTKNVIVEKWKAHQ